MYVYIYTYFYTVSLYTPHGANGSEMDSLGSTYYYTGNVRHMNVSTDFFCFLFLFFMLDCFKIDPLLIWLHVLDKDTHEKKIEQERKKNTPK